MTTSTHPDSKAFTKQRRLLTSAQFQFVFDRAPIKASHPTLLILAKPNTETHARIGLVIGKKHVKTAVERNRLKRLIRESFRTRQLPALDVIVLARAGAGTLDNDEVLKILNGLWQRVSKKSAKL